MFFVIIILCVIYISPCSGGDDCVLKGWDIRQERATFFNTFHTAGVCSLQCNPHNPEILLSGSYDERIAVWDIRSMAVPLHTIETGGGVWVDVASSNKTYRVYIH